MTRPLTLAAAIPAALLLAACGSTQAPPARHHAKPAAVATTAAPSPSPTIPADRADRVVCRHFMHQEPGKAGANKYMAWAAFGKGEHITNRSAGKLITATVKWFDDSYVSWGNPAHANADWAAVSGLCASAGVDG